jgi:hypothetical protein
MAGASFQIDGRPAYRVHNRRNLQRIVAKSQNEEAVMRMSDLDQRARARLAALEQADGVIFGEVVDDSQSGEIVDRR